MPARRYSTNADVIRVEVVFPSIRAQPANRALAIMNLRWKFSDVVEAIIDAHNRHLLGGEMHNWANRFAAVLPPAAIKPDDRRQSFLHLSRAINIKAQRLSIDPCVLDVPVHADSFG